VRRLSSSLGQPGFHAEDADYPRPRHYGRLDISVGVNRIIPERIGVEGVNEIIMFGYVHEVQTGLIRRGNIQYILETHCAGLA
jgi:hypothetical protein